MEIETRRIDLGLIEFSNEQSASANFSGIFVLPKSSPPSPFEIECNEELIIWGEEIGLIDENNKERVIAAFFPSLFGSKLKKKSLLTKQSIVSLFLFVLDDQLDRRAVKINTKLLFHAFKTFMKLFDGSISNTNNALSIQINGVSPSEAFILFKFEPLCKAAEWIRKYILIHSRGDLSFFLNSTWDYLTATVWACEGGFRRSGRSTLFVPSMLSYLFMRLRTGACFVAMATLLLLTGRNFTKELHQDPNIELMLQLVNYHIVLFNDYASFLKECGMSDKLPEDNGENLFAIKCREFMKVGKKQPLQRSVNFVIKIMNETVEQIGRVFVVLSKDQREIIYPAIDCLVDNVRWSLKSKRYRLNVLDNSIIETRKSNL